MHPAYDARMHAFGDDAVVLMRLALDDPDRSSALRAQLDYLRAATPASVAAWAAGERDAEIARLEAATTVTPSVAASAVSPADPTPAGPPELAPEDRDRFVHAMATFRAGNVAGAYQLARPLFASYPEDYAVADLRCQLATVRWLDPKAMLEECAAAVRLADAGAPRPGR
jgi:hypothetical protein